MRDLLYYPWFEVRDIDWLKFALIYFDSIRPIVPLGIPFNSVISPEFRRISEETDLINAYQPDYEENHIASVFAIEKINNYLSWLYKNRSSEFSKQITNNHNTILYNGKYTDIFYDYCIENGYATPCNEGIRISENLAFIYMSVLADIVSRNNSFEMITDSRQYASILLNNRPAMSSRTYTGKHMRTLELELDIPLNLHDLPLGTFIRLRQDRTFNQCRRAFMQEMTRRLDAIENGNTGYSTEEFLSYKLDFIKACRPFFTMAAVTAVNVFSVHELFNDASAGNIIQTASNMYLNMTAVDYDEIRRFINNLKTKHLARRYVSTLKSISTLTARRPR